MATFKLIWSLRRRWPNFRRRCFDRYVVVAFSLRSTRAKIYNWICVVTFNDIKPCCEFFHFGIQSLALSCHCDGSVSVLNNCYCYYCCFCCCCYYCCCRLRRHCHRRCRCVVAVNAVADIVVVRFHTILFTYTVLRYKRKHVHCESFVSVLKICWDMKALSPSIVYYTVLCAVYCAVLCSAAMHADRRAAFGIIFNVRRSVLSHVKRLYTWIHVNRQPQSPE